MSVEYDPLATEQGQKVSEAIDKIKSGTPPKKALRESRVDLRKLSEYPLHREIQSCLTQWYLNNVEIEAAVKAKLMEDLYQAGDPKERATAAKELREWVQESQAKVTGLAAQVNVFTERDRQILEELSVDELDIDDEDK